MNDFQDTVPVPPMAPAQAPTPASVASAAEAAARRIEPGWATADHAAPVRHALRFTGSGSEYFRIWIVNLLLIVVTLSLYYPYARLRRLRYFYGNTWVGEHALSFDGSGARMLRGYLLVGLLFLVYSNTAQSSPGLALLALLVLVLLWPALFRSGQRFRCSHTHWRGLAAGFTGDTRTAYARLWPLQALSLLYLGLGPLQFALGVDLSAADAPDSANPAAKVLMAIAGLATLAMPWALWRIKHYQHSHYAFAGERATFGVGAWALYRIVMVAGLVMAGIGLVAGVVVTAMPLLAMLAVIVMPLLWLGLSSHLMAQWQNAVWNGSSTTSLRVTSELATGALMRLRLRNGFLTLVTLGLYWPFAAVATARLRLEAVSVELAPGFDQLVASASAAERDATGDAVGEVFGLDAGL